MTPRCALLGLLLLAAFAACEKPKETPPTPPAPAKPVAPPAEEIAAETRNLLNMAYGATVISRTGELTLKASAVFVIDGDPATGWMSPPSDNEQSMVLALPARSRIEQIGIQTVPAASVHVKGALFEVSSDGQTFSKLYEAKFESQRPPQVLAVEPVEAKYLRVTTTDAPGRFARLDGVHVRGEMLDTPVRGTIAGCWNINGFDARFDDEGGRVTGTLTEHGLVTLEGAAEGMVYRFAWRRDGETGVAAITVSGDSLTGLQWYEEPQAKNVAMSWFGQRRACGSSPASAMPVAERFLAKKAGFPLFTRSPDTVLSLLAKPGTRLRLIAHEYREASPDGNRRRAQAELAQMREVLAKAGADLTRLDFVASGSDRPRVLLTSELQRVMYSVIEVEGRD